MQVLSLLECCCCRSLFVSQGLLDWGSEAYFWLIDCVAKEDKDNGTAACNL